MLTLKLCNTRDKSVVILETPSVRVSGNRVMCDRVDDMGADEYLIDGGDYDVAYVENSRGSTVQVVKP